MEDPLGALRASIMVKVVSGALAVLVAVLVPGAMAAVAAARPLVLEPVVAEVMIISVAVSLILDPARQAE
jgi:predicted phage tail protein